MNIFRSDTINYNVYINIQQNSYANEQTGIDLSARALVIKKHSFLPQQ